MGVVNVTPDSFSDGGRYLDANAAIAHARMMIDEGVDLVDVGGESTRPGAAPVSEAEELARILPVVSALHDFPVSVDTRHPGVMRAALAAGASMINDIQALTAVGALDAVAAGNCGVCLMHKKGDPATMQEDPRYGDVVAEVRDYLAGRIAACEAAGVARERIVADPGFGFGKTVEHNLTLLSACPSYPRSACRCWLVGRVNRRSAASRGATPASGWRAASPPLCSRCSAAREYCACTT